MAELGVRAPLPLLEQQVSPDPNLNRNRNRNRNRNPNPNPSPNPVQPLLLSLGAARVQTAATYLEGYVGRARLAEFVRLHPQVHPRPSPNLAPEPSPSPTSDPSPSACTRSRCSGCLTRTRRPRST